VGVSALDGDGQNEHLRQYVEMDGYLVKRKKDKRLSQTWLDRYHNLSSSTYQIDSYPDEEERKLASRLRTRLVLK
jgi:hypothetical protein